MNAQQLRNSILQQAIQGKLVPQDPNDEPASVLLQRIRKEKERLVKEGKLKKKDLESKSIEEDEIPFEIPKSWEWCRISSIASVLGGKRIPAGRKLSQENTGHVYIRVSDMKENTVSTDNLQYVPEDIYPSISRYIINKEDVYITVAGTIGRIGKIPFELDGANLTENADRLVFSVIDQDWLIKCLQSNIVQTQIVDVTTKVGQPKLAIARIQNLLIPLPPLAEQRRIVAKIEKLMPLVERYGNAQQALDQLNESLPARLRQSILQEAIQGRLVPQDPKEELASELLKRIRKEKEQLVKEGKLKKKDLESKPIEEDEIPFEIPESWEWVRLNSISKTITKGTTPRGGNVAYSSTGIGFLRAENVGGFDELDLSRLKFVTEEEHQGFLSRSKIEADDILITIAGTLGRTALVKEKHLPLNANQAVSIVRLVNSKLLSLMYLIYSLNEPSIQKVLTKQKKVTAIPNLTLEIISDCIIPLPPLSEQKRIVAKVEELFGVIK